MKHILALMLFVLRFSVLPANAEGPRQNIEINATPFEPRCDLFFDCRDKFHHPPELISPQFLYPFEMRRPAFDGEVVVLVEIAHNGFAKKLSVLNGTNDLFIREAINALSKAQWSSGTDNVWFYYKATFSTGM